MVSTKTLTTAPIPVQVHFVAWLPQMYGAIMAHTEAPSREAITSATVNTSAIPNGTYITSGISGCDGEFEGWPVLI